jgi:DNA invertase Pin-like site-specific DNA recombinase
MNLAGYIRVSTEGQVDAYGKDIQRDSILTWAGLNGHTITHFYEEDAVSGKVDGGDRPILKSLIDQAEAKRVEGIVVLDPTRLARRLLVQETLLALLWSSDLRVFTTTTGELDQNDDDPTRIMIRQIFGVLAEFEHRTIVNRLQSGRRQKIAQGGYAGGEVRYGVAVEGTGKTAQFVVNQTEAEVIELIDRLHLAGMSKRGIARTLNERGLRTKHNKSWTQVQVSRIIERYADNA